MSCWRMVVVFILVLVEAPGRKHYGFGAHVSCQIFGSGTLYSVAVLIVCSLAIFYVA